MFDFFARLFRGEPSGAKAKERLRLVLLSDHLALAPDVVESLRRDLLDVISRYVEVDVDNVDVTFEQREHEVAMLANVPILSVRNGRAHSAPAPRTPLAPAPSLAAEAPSLAPLEESFWTEPVAEPAPAAAAAAVDALAETDRAPAETHGSPAEMDGLPLADAAVVAGAAPKPTRPRRRRRRRTGTMPPPPGTGEQRWGNSAPP
jgi:cell division topological specificity factor